MCPNHLAMLPPNKYFIYQYMKFHFLVLFSMLTRSHLVLVLKAHLPTQILLILCKGLPLVVDDKKDSRIWYRMGKTCKERVGQRGLEGWGHLVTETWSLQDEHNHRSCSIYMYNNNLIFSKQIWIFFHICSTFNISGMLTDKVTKIRLLSWRRKWSVTFWS